VAVVLQFRQYVGSDEPVAPVSVTFNALDLLGRFPPRRYSFEHLLAIIPQPIVAGAPSRLGDLTVGQTPAGDRLNLLLVQAECEGPRWVVFEVGVRLVAVCRGLANVTGEIASISRRGQSGLVVALCPAAAGREELLVCAGVVPGRGGAVGRG